MGAITFAGEGASSAQNTIDTTAAGDIWDNTFCLYTTYKCKCRLKLYYGLYRHMVDGLGVQLHTLEVQLVKKQHWLCFNLYWC